jgi:HEAT repeat protein
MMRSLYMMQSQQIDDALECYENAYAQGGKHDFEVLQQLGHVLLRHGSRSEDPQIVAMSLFGAGLSGSSGVLDILAMGLFHPDPQIQMVALHFIAKIEDDRTDELLNRAMSSDYLSTRMEAAFYMAQKKHPYAVGQIEGLMVRLPPFFRPFFPSLFTLVGTADATLALRRLADDLDPQVRVESILNIAKLARDDFLPLLRKRLSHSNLAELEAAAFAIGALKDSKSLPRLRKLTSSSSDNVRIAAILALHSLGERTHVPALEDLARLRRNVFAISALGQVPGTEDTLAEIAKSYELSTRLNASISLLMHRDPRCLKGITEIVITDPRDLAFYMMPSLGRTMAIWKAVPSAELRSKDKTIDLSLSLSMREHILREAIHLPEATFLQLVRELFDHQQFDLIPTAVLLLENLRTSESIALLKEGAAKVGAPLIRDYCHLALFRLKEEGPYGEYIHHWVMRQKDAELIRLRPVIPWKMRLESDYTLTPEETSRLLVDSLFAIASERDIDFLLKAIRLGNPQNRYALFGLLMRATE